MPSYTQSNTDPVTVNGMYMKYYLDILRGMADTFRDGGNVKSFHLYSLFLRACVVRKDLRDGIDDEIKELNEKISSGLYGDLGSDQDVYIRGFCIVSAAMKFIGDAFHIIQYDSASLADITDDELMVEFERHAMHRTVRTALNNNKDRMKLFEKRILDGNITNMAALMQELTMPDELIPQDDVLTQEAMAGGEDDQQF
jgi:hypothetical protein